MMRASERAALERFFQENSIPTSGAAGPILRRLLFVISRASVLPLSLPPRGLSKHEAAAYLGISATLFETILKEGLMPAPKRIHSRVVWDRLQLDAAWDALPDDFEEEYDNPFDKPATKS